MSRLAMALGAALLASAGPAAAEGVSPLIGVDWVRANADRSDVVVLDVRNAIDGGSRASYAEGHIPGAVHSDYLEDGWRTTVDGVVGQTPPVDQLEALIGGLGIDNDSTVVVVPAGIDSSDLGSATRIYWTFRYLGHDAVAILDGGWRAWTASPDNPVESGVNEPAPATFVAEVRSELLADTDEVQERLDSGRGTLLDARPEGQFRGGEKHPAARAGGHIPGAAHLDQSRTFDGASGRLRDETELAALVATVIGEDEGEVVSYCNTGHWASVNWFVLSEVLGEDGVRLYDGSMVGWTHDPARPVSR